MDKDCKHRLEMVAYSTVAALQVWELLTNKKNP